MTMTQPDDLSARLSRPGIPDAFEATVSLLAEAAALHDVYTMARAGYAFAHLYDLTGNRPEDYNPLIILVRDAAMEAVRVAAGMTRSS